MFLSGTLEMNFFSDRIDFFLDFLIIIIMIFCCDLLDTVEERSDGCVFRMRIIIADVGNIYARQPNISLSLFRPLRIFVNTLKHSQSVIFALTSFYSHLSKRWKTEKIDGCQFFKFLFPFWYLWGTLKKNFTTCLAKINRFMPKKGLKSCIFNKISIKFQ